MLFGYAQNYYFHLRMHNVLPETRLKADHAQATTRTTRIRYVTVEATTRCGAAGVDVYIDGIKSLANTFVSPLRTAGASTL